MVLTSEQQVNWVMGLLRHAGDRSIETTAEAQSEWVKEVERYGQALIASRTKSWYTGANVPGKPRFFLPFAGGFDTYQAACGAVADSDYSGFLFT
jgi:cyclohexanone monooxygenase